MNLHRAAAAAVAVAVLVAGCTAQQPEPSPTLSPASRSPSPSAQPAPSVAWVEAEVPDSAIGSATLVVVPGGEGMVVIGYDGQFGSTVWTSADGEAWSDVTQPGLEAAGIASAVAFQDQLVAVGRDTADVDIELAAAWISADGTEWRRVAGGNEMEGQLVDVVALEGGLVGIGGVPGADAAGVWTSADGETWQRQDAATMEHAFFWSVAEGGPGLITTGWRRNPEPDLAVWTSSDGGASWTLAPDPEGFEGFEGRDVIGFGGRLVIVGGSVFESGARIWTSTDGLAWELAADLADASIRSIAATPLGLVAVGTQGTDAAAWISHDGLAWEPFGEPIPNAYFNSAFVADDRLVVTGATQVETSDQGIVTHAAIWTTDLD